MVFYLVQLLVQKLKVQSEVHSWKKNYQIKHKFFRLCSFMLIVCVGSAWLWSLLFRFLVVVFQHNVENVKHKYTNNTVPVGLFSYFTKFCSET